MGASVHSILKKKGLRDERINGKKVSRVRVGRNKGGRPKKNLVEKTPHVEPIRQ